MSETAETEAGEADERNETEAVDDILGGSTDDLFERVDQELAEE
jgi:hypothetical protein